MVSPRRASRSPWPLRLAFGASVAAIAAVHGPILGYKTYANVDEAYACALASRLLDGHKLYQGAISQRGPLMYYAFEGFAWLHGWDNVFALRVWALLLAVTHVALVGWIAKRLLSRAAATVAVALTGYALSFGFPPEDGVAVNGEVLQLPAMMLAVLIGALAMRAAPATRARLLGLAGSGILFGVAVAIKQSIVLHAGPLLFWVFVDAHRRRTGLRKALLDAAVLGAGCAVVPLAFVLHAWSQGTLRDMYYYTVVYNRDVHLKPVVSVRLAWLTPLFHRVTTLTGFTMGAFMLAAVAAGWLWRRARAAIGLRSGWALVRGFRAKHYLALHLALALFAASSMYRFFPHYYVQAWPFFALVAGSIADRASRRAASRHALVGFGAFMLAGAGLGLYFGEKADGRVAHDETILSMAHVVEVTTKPEDRVFVWGFSPWIYGYSHRKPASRFVFHTYPTGFVPWYGEKLSVEAARVVPGSMEALLGDLERERPAVIVDAGAVMMNRPMRTYRATADYLYAHYCFEMRVGALDLYRRKGDGASCEQPHFPEPAACVDYLGRGLFLPLPHQVDEGRAKKLPVGNFFRPIYFLDGPRPASVAAFKDERIDREDAELRAAGLKIPELEPACP
jgi:4-amino-4-deoxy-L-arabinose transferase-like glycosyltransferase